MKALDLRSFEQGIRDYWKEIGRRSAHVQARERAFELISSHFSARTPPYLTRDELILIIKWKHTDGRWCKQSLEGLQHVGDDRLVELTRHIGDIDVPDLLERFHGAIGGVGIATVSAIITAARPDRFAVIDDFALRAIYFHYDTGWVRLVSRDKKGRFQPTEKDYIPFVQFCRQRALELSELAQQPWTPRKVEMALWAVGKDLSWRTIPNED